MFFTVWNTQTTLRATAVECVNKRFNCILNSRKRHVVTEVIILLNKVQNIFGKIDLKISRNVLFESVDRFQEVCLQSLNDIFVGFVQTSFLETWNCFFNLLGKDNLALSLFDIKLQVSVNKF